jgi:glycosyltransferase 2 family protein
MKTFQQILVTLRRLAPWIALCAVVLALAPHGTELLNAWRRMLPGYLLASFAVCLVCRPLNAGGWGWVLDALGAPLPFFMAARIWLLSDSLRWLHGLCVCCSRVDSARQAGVTALAASLSLPVELGITVASWVALGIVGLVPSGLAYRLVSAHLSIIGWISFASAAGLLTGALVVWRLRRLTPVMNTFAQLKALVTLRPKALLLLFKPGVLYVALNAMNGIGLWILLTGLGLQNRVDLPTVIGANAVGWLAGFFAFGVPGGIGVREGCTVLILSNLLPWHEAALAALVYRSISTCAELAILLPCLTLPKRQPDKVN